MCRKSHTQLSVLVGLLLALLAVPASDVWAATSVYHSPKDDGVSGTGIPGGGTQTLYLYVDGGPTASLAGSACHDGAGDEVCGFDLAIEGANGLTFVSFSADPGANLLVNFTPGLLRVNGLDTQAPTTGTQRIGELVVNAVAGGAVELSAGEVVGAGLGSEALGTQTLATVPEPGSLLLLVSGLGLLRGFAWRRARAGR